MSEQVQHLRARIGLEALKDLLLTKEKLYRMLNPEHQIWLCVNHGSATELAYSKLKDLPESCAQKLADTIFVLRGAVVVRLLHGVTTEYYLYKKRISKQKAEREYGTEFITMVEEFKKTYETYFKHIKKEAYAQKYAKLAEVLGEERASNLIKSEQLELVSINGFFSNLYVDLSQTTTPEEQSQLSDLGIEVRI